MAQSLKFPIDTDNVSSFILNEDIGSNAKQNLKMLILTDKGERLMIPDYGVGLRRFLFENLSNGNILQDGKAQKLQKILFEEISKQARKYTNNIGIEDLTIEQIDNTIKLNIYYSINGVYSDSLEISV